MAETIKSVLLFDYDSIHRSVARTDAGLADQLGSRAGAWLEAIETGEIVAPAAVEVRRRFQMKRGYADPRLLGKNRGWLTANGVQVVECAVPTGLARGANLAHLILDALGASEPDPEEVIVLSAEADLTPLLLRLRALSQRVVIYATDMTAPAYRAFADGTVEESLLLRVLSRQAEPAAARGSIPRPPRLSPGVAGPDLRRAPAAARPEPVAAPPAEVLPPERPQAKASSAARAKAAPIDREALAALVRRIHEATNVPLFSPKTFGDLFRYLVEDVAANGYKFQATADNVAAAMNVQGRNVTKRQVGFIIKGLALRGHVFTADDRPERLAELFYEQVLYLADTAKVALSEVEKGLVLAWVGGVRREDLAAPAEDAPLPPAPPPVRDEAPARAAGPRPTASARPAAGAAAKRKEPEPIVTPPPPRARPAAAARPEPAAPPVRPEPAAAETAPPSAEIKRPTPSMPRAPGDAPTRPVRQPLRESIAQRASEGGPAAPAAARRPPPRPPQSAADQKDEAELEDSILSAIADAVDVLVEDGGPDAAPPRPAPIAESPPPAARAPPPRPAAPRAAPAATSQRPAASPAAAPAPAPAVPSKTGSDADEIGDEIQRILSSFKR